MQNTTTLTTKALRLRRSVARKARVALATALVAAGLVLPPLAAGLVAPSVHAATTTTNPPIVVNFNGDLSDNDPNDGVCDASAGNDQPCTLRAAIQVANARPGPDDIDFAVTEAFRDPATGVVTIRPNSELPAITGPVTIDGYTQTGAEANTKAVGDDASLRVEIDGTNLSDGTGLEISDSSNSVVRGLVIDRFAFGIFIHGDSVGNRVEGNFIGTDPTGTLERGNGFHGVVIISGPSKTVVGGSTPAKRNILSANRATGVEIIDSDFSRIQGNYVGTDKSGTNALGNDNGIKIESGASDTMVGGTTAASRNVISGNDLQGISLNDSRGTRVLGNRIGAAASGTAPLGNGFNGVQIANSPDNEVGDGTSAGSNTIAFNGHDGLGIGDLSGVTSTGNRISRNSIFSNAGLGIDLIGPGENFLTDVSTPNDGDDPSTPQVDPDGDTGPNDLQNKPVVGSAKTSSTATTVKGTLVSTPNQQTFVVRFYSNPAGGDEGKTFLGQTTASTDGSGKASFAKALPKVSVGKTVTATATSVGGDTSEFSAPRTVVSA